MTPTREQLIDALVKESEYLCHDDFNPDEDPTPEEYLEMINTLSYEELVEEITTAYGWCIKSLDYRHILK